MAQFNEKSLMQGVYDKLLADGACEPALVILLENKDKTVSEFFADGENNTIGIHYTRTPLWAYWVATHYYDKNVFPREIIWKCIQATMSKDAPVSNIKLLRFFRKANKHLNKKQKNEFKKSFAGKLPRLEKKEKL